MTIDEIQGQLDVLAEIVERQQRELELLRSGQAQRVDAANAVRAVSAELDGGQEVSPGVHSRRQMIRKGAVALGAGVAAVGLSSQPAAAADGDNIEIGADNGATSTTILETTKTGGEAFRGTNLADTGLSDGLFGLASSPDGAGVRAGNDSLSGKAYGIFAVSGSPEGVAIEAGATSISGSTTAVKGVAGSSAGTGVVGEALNQNGTFDTTGVIGRGTAVGVRGEGEVAMIADSPNIGVLAEAPTAMIAVGKVAVGTTAHDPAAPLHVQQSGSTDPVELCLQLESSVPPQQVFKTGHDEWFFAMTSDKQFKISKNGTGGVEAKFFDNGNLTLRGTLTETSDVNVKHDIQTIDPQHILDRLIDIDIATWRYNDDPQALHLGPMAQDFAAAFGLGDTTTGIANIDANGVAFAAIQALHNQNQQLHQQNAELVSRVERLENNG